MASLSSLDTWLQSLPPSSLALSTGLHMTFVCRQLSLDAGPTLLQDDLIPALSFINTLFLEKVTFEVWVDEFWGGHYSVQCDSQVPPSGISGTWPGFRCSDPAQGPDSLPAPHYCRGPILGMLSSVRGDHSGSKCGLSPSTASHGARDLRTESW